MKKIFQKIGLLFAFATIALTNVNLAMAAPSVISVDNMIPTVDVAKNPGNLIKQVVTLVFVLAAALTFFYLIAGAIAWITSGGDKGKVEEARNKITAAVIGLLILAATWAIFVLITNIAFGGQSQLQVPGFTQNDI